MKNLIIGIGQCGSRIADEFNRLNRKAKGARGVEIITGTFAMDTDADTLSELKYIKADYQRRILLGIPQNRGHGNIADNKIGAEIVKKEVDKIVDAVHLVKRFPETDAIIIVASTAGGTGSGGLPVVIQNIKERYKDKGVYGLAVFPFDYELKNEKYYTSNTASCLKSSYAVADGMFLFDNQKFLQRDPSLIHDIERVNKLIIEPFYNLLCAGEEKNPRYIGSKLMDAGDIMQTIKGWTVLGHGESQLSLTRRILKKSLDFTKKSRETDVGISVIEEAISNFSMKCNPPDAATALYLLSAPAREMSVNLLDEISDYMKSLATNAIIRSGDYPSRWGLISIDIILSQLETVDKIQKIYEETVENTEKM